jgi:alpha-beta hydrolase superfamily lysophospholipase
MKWVRRLILAAIVVAVLFQIFIVGAAFYGAGQMQVRRSPNEYRTLGSNPRSALGLAYEDVTFKAEDGKTLRGWFVPSAATSDVGVVTVHGLGANREEFMPDAKMLHDAGYSVLMFDCRGHGTSDGDGRTLSLGVREHRDVEAAVAYLKQNRGMKRVAVQGCSQGAVSAIEAAAEDKSIDGVIAEASFASLYEIMTVGTNRARPDLKPWFVAMMTDIAVWKMGGRGLAGPVDAVAQIAPRPVLLMQGSDDEVVPPNDVQVLYDHAREPKSIWIGDGAGHCQLRRKYPEQYRQHIMDFLTKYFPVSK